jgi:hypothetical protein
MPDIDLSDARLQVEFEEWAVDYVKGMDSRGAYTSPYTQIAWTAWQASAVTIARRVASRPQQEEDNAGLVKELRCLASLGRAAGSAEDSYLTETLDRAASALSRAGEGDNPVDKLVRENCLAGHEFCVWPGCACQPSVPAREVREAVAAPRREQE